MMEILLEVQHLTIAYPQNREVVRELNLCLKKGERLGIVGESGAGKTTLAMALAGINNQEQTRSGTVTFYGKQRGIILQNAMTCLDPLMKIKDQLKRCCAKVGSVRKKRHTSRRKNYWKKWGFVRQNNTWGVIRLCVREECSRGSILPWRLRRIRIC